MADSPLSVSEDEETVQISPVSTIQKSVDGERGKKRAAKRVTLTRNACTDCRQSKCKCDGARPICGRCAKRSTHCNYDVADDGTTKMQQLAQQLQEVDTAYNLVSQFFKILQSVPEELAYALLGRVRVGEQVADIISVLERAMPPGPGSMDESIKHTGQEQGRQQLPRQMSIDEWFPGAETGESWNSWSQRCEKAKVPPSETKVEDAPL